MSLYRALFLIFFFLCLFLLYFIWMPDESFSESVGLMRSGVEMNINMYIGMVYDLPDLRPTPQTLLFNPSRACWETDLPAF